MTHQHVSRTNQQTKSYTPLVSGILPRAAVRNVPEKDVQPTQEEEATTFRESRFHHNFCQVPASTGEMPRIQPKLKIGAVGDRYEQEADRVAQDVVQRINAPAPERGDEDEVMRKTQEGTLQREEMPEEEDDKELRMKPMVQRLSTEGGMATPPDLDSSIQRARGGGQPLGDGIRKPMERAFGADFSGVKVHTDSHSDQLNQFIQAKAFTTGQDVFFRHGAYQPGSRGGQELIAHELTHVVQQNGGAVRRSPYARQKLPQHLDQKARHEPHIPGMEYPQAQLQPVVQRALGFEFETGWKVWDRTPVKIWEKSGRQGRPPEATPLAKKDLVYQGLGFKIEADEAGGGEAELEFIVHPPVEATLSGKDDLFKRMVDVTLLGAHLISAAKASDTNKFTMNQATRNIAQEKFLIAPADAELGARPQVTAGISLSKIPQLENAQGNVRLPSAIESTHQAAASLKVDVENAADHYQKVCQKAMSDNLKGLLYMVASYLWGADATVEYVKQIADRFLLARTDFATLFKLLPEEEQTFLKKYPNLFINFSLIAAGRDLNDRGLHVLPKIWIDVQDLNKGKKQIGPTIEKWLFMITQGYDILSAAHLKEMRDYYLQNDPEQVNLGKEVESFGELGRKTERVGSSGKGAGIFELRSAALAGKKGIVPLLGWQPFTEQMMDYFINLEE